VGAGCKFSLSALTFEYSDIAFTFNLDHHPRPSPFHPTFTVTINSHTHLQDYTLANQDMVQLLLGKDRQRALLRLSMLQVSIQTHSKPSEAACSQQCSIFWNPAFVSAWDIPISLKVTSSFSQVLERIA
jgi:hypothetical protein